MRVILIIAVILMAGLGHAATVTVGPEESIQAAIDAAAPGDTIEVEGGVYQENINITKQLTIRGVKITQHGIDNPVVVGGMIGDCITIYADEVVLEGFVATNGFSGIVVLSKNNTLEHNIANYNRDFGITIKSGDNNYLGNSTAISNGKAGIFLIEGADNNSVRGSKVTKNPYGIVIDTGPLGKDSVGNILFQNNLFENEANAYDFSENQWDDGIRGNYYDDNLCSDLNNDGLCDSEHKIPGGSSVDRHPLTKPPL